MFVTEWVAIPKERIDFPQCNRVLVECGVRLCVMCWNKRCEVLHEPKFKKKIFNKRNEIN